jgi:mRNA interferase HicA
MPMKRRDLILKLKSAGFTLYRHGSEHDIFTNKTTAVQVPRHTEIKELTAKRILKDAGLK